MPASKTSRKRSHSHRHSKNDGFFRPGSFLSELTGGSHATHSRKSRGSRKSRRSRGSRRMKKSLSYKRSRKNSTKDTGVKEEMQTQPHFRDFIKGHYGAARSIVMKAGETGKGLVTGTFRELGKMWQIQKQGTGSRKGSRKASRKYGSHKSRVSRMSRKSRKTTGNGDYRDFVKGNYHAARTMVMKTGKTGTSLTRGTMKQVAKWWQMNKEGKAYTHTKKSEGYRHKADCKYSRKYGSHKSRSSKGSVVCMCALVHGKSKTAKKNDLNMKTARSYSRKSRNLLSRKIGPLNKGTLTQFGYHTDIKNKEERREKLKMAIEKYGWVAVMRKLNLIAIFDKNKHPTKAKVFRADAKWVSRTYNMKK
jgi:hypothetical protein